MEPANRDVERLRALLALQGTKAGLWDWEVPTGAVVFNERWAQIVGRTLADLEPVSIETWGALCHPDDLLLSNEQIARCREGENAYYECECRMRHADGSWIWVLDRGKVIEWMPDGSPRRMVGTHIDITERRHSEMVARVQRDLALALNDADSLPDTLWLCLDAAIEAGEMDAGGIYVASEEDGALELACHRGLSDTFVQGSSRFEKDSPHGRLVAAGRAHYVDHGELSRQLRKQAAAQELRALGVVPLRFGGRTVGCLNVASHERDAVTPASQAALESIASQAGQAIDRFHAVARSRASEANLQSLFDTVQDFLFVLDLTGRIVAVNRVVPERLGLGESELLGKPVTVVHPPKRAAEVAEIAGRMLRGETSLSTIPLATRSGDEIPVETHVTHGTWNGRPALIGVSRDISDRLQGERERLRLERSLQQAQRLESLGLLTGGIAHHFNNALMTITGNAELALTDVADDSDAAESLREIDDAADKLSTLCRQMLTFAGGQKYDTRRLDLARFLEQRRPRLVNCVPMSSSLDVVLPTALPPIEADPDRLLQVLENLIVNASEALPNSGGHIRVSAGLESISTPSGSTSALGGPLAPGPYVYVEVSDTGSGIDSETLQRIFDPFYTTRFLGRGLGMATCQAIVRGHGGALRVDSELGRGTTVRALFPVPPL